MSDLDQLKEILAGEVDNTFSLEQRTAAQLLENISQYTQLIPFASNQEQLWNSFWFKDMTPEKLAEIYQDFSLAEKRLPVQQTFLLALLRLLETPRLLLNTVPARHRSLYYHDLLGFTRQGSKPDRVVVDFALQRGTAQYLLPSGTLLDAGQDNAGKNITYLTDESLLISRQQLSKLCWTRQKDPTDASSGWLICTALDEDSNISLPAEGVRLFGPTEQEDALTQTLRLTTPLAGLTGALEITADWNTKENGTLSQPTLSLVDHSQTRPFQLAAGNNSQTVYRLSDLQNSGRARAGSEGQNPQLVLQIAEGENDSFPSSLSVTLADCQQIGYRGQDGQGHINTFSYPFGVTPQAGSAFELFLPAAFAQTGGELTIEPQGRDLPQQSFVHWYQGYPDAPTDNSAFNVQIYLITPQGSQLLKDEQPLFSGEGMPESVPLRVTLPADNASAATGYTLRVELSRDFLHSAWQQDPADKNAPWTPQVSRVNTRFQQALSLSDEAEKLTRLQGDATTKQALWLGFSDVIAGETLSLYWSLNAPSALALSWFSYNGEEWTPLEAGLADNTDGLFTSGLWQAVLPEDIAPGGVDDVDKNKDYYWVKAVPSEGKAISAVDAPRLRAIVANAVTATLNTQTDIDDSHFAQALPAGTITQLVTPVAEISSVNQPLPSVEGSAGETESELFQRAAARLSHRQRAITWGNMRTMLMSNYPNLFDVKFPDIDKLSHIPALEEQVLMVIPDGRYRDNDDPLRPTLSAGHLDEMQKWLEQYTSLWASPRLTNPVYIDVTAKYRVAFNVGVNPDYGYSQLAVLLQQQYMPWREDQSQGATSGNQIDYYGLLAVMQQSPLVQRVISLTLNYKDDEGHDVSARETVSAKDNQVLILIPQADTSSLKGENHV